MVTIDSPLQILQQVSRFKGVGSRVHGKVLIQRRASFTSSRPMLCLESCRISGTKLEYFSMKAWNKNLQKCSKHLRGHQISSNHVCLKMYENVVLRLSWSCEIGPRQHHRIHRIHPATGCLTRACLCMTYVCFTCSEI